MLIVQVMLSMLIKLVDQWISLTAIISRFYIISIVILVV